MSGWTFFLVALAFKFQHPFFLYIGFQVSASFCCFRVAWVTSWRQLLKQCFQLCFQCCLKSSLWLEWWQHIMLDYNQKGSSQINQKATIIWRSHHKLHCVYDNWISWRSSKLMFSCTTSNGSKQIHLTLILHSLLALSFNLIWVFFRVRLTCTNIWSFSQKGTLGFSVYLLKLWTIVPYAPRNLDPRVIWVLINPYVQCSIKSNTPTMDLTRIWPKKFFHEAHPILTGPWQFLVHHHPYPSIRIAGEKCIAIVERDIAEDWYEILYLLN